MITGGTRGLGAAMARHFVGAGADVVVAARTRPAERVAGRFVQADVATPDGVAGLAGAVLELLGGVDVLVDNAGGHSPAPGGVLTATDTDWLDDLGANLLSAVRLDRALVPHMVAQGRGAVVHVTSGAARLPQPAQVPYAAAKAALTTYSKALATEVGPHGVRVNAVVPGVVESAALGSALEAMAEAGGTDVDGARTQIVERFGIPLGRVGSADEVARLVVFLASPQAGYLTGSQYAVDGGLMPTV